MLKPVESWVNKVSHPTFQYPHLELKTGVCHHRVDEDAGTNSMGKMTKPISSLIDFRAQAPAA